MIRHLPSHASRAFRKRASAKPAQTGRLRAAICGSLIALAGFGTINGSLAQTPPRVLIEQLRAANGASASQADPEALKRAKEEGLAALSNGQAEPALSAYEQAARMIHAPDVELGLVRAMMLNGHYRRALAFGAHAAGAHTDFPTGSALYAWLLHSGGQAGAAQSALDIAQARSPNDLTLVALRAALATTWPQLSGSVAQPEASILPFAWGTPVPSSTRVIGSATLVGQGEIALAPLGMVQGASKVWVRNGLGQTVSASIDQIADGLPIARLRLESPLPMGMNSPAHSAEPFGGLPAYFYEYSTGAGQQAGWPLQRQSFLSPQPSESGLRRLGAAIPLGPRGGPVFDAGGRWLGMSTMDAAGESRFVSAFTLTERLSLPGPSSSTPASRATPIAPGEIYERALLTALQLIVAQ